MASRFLLDQNFPAPILDVSAVDDTVEYVALETFDASLTRMGTPDWLIYLSAAEDGSFTGVVTRDSSQLDAPEELVALTYTAISLVTWKQPIEDPIKEWGQLIAYMPEVLRRIERDGPRVFLLPHPRLSIANVHAPRALLGQLASREGRSFPEIREEARRSIREELGVRGLSRLDSLVNPSAR